MRTRAALIAVVFLSTFTSAQKNSVPKELLGRWDASLNNSTEGVPFGLEIRSQKGKLSAAVLNGPEHWPFSSAKFENGTLTLRFDQYDGTLTAKYDRQKKEWVGEYRRPYAKGIVEYPFEARRPHYTKTTQPSFRSAKMITGEWVYKLEANGKEAEKGLAVFSLRGSKATATLIPVSGDSGLLAGTADGSQPYLRLSRFDGIHLIYLQISLGSASGLMGSYHSGKSARLEFSADPRDLAPKEDQPENPFELTKVKDPNEPFQFSAPDPRSAKPVAASDPEFKNKVVIVDIMGTWCPNCHDEEPLLVDLYNRYHKDGLEIVSLAYEYTDNAAQNARQIEIFRKKYNVPYPILIAGTTDDGQIRKTLPQLVGFGAFPTTIFVGRDGRVSKIHAGYSGPATGRRFNQVQNEMDQIVRDLLKAPATTAAR